jgi:hypothetical protein
MKADPLRILAKQLLSIKDGAEAALETIGLILDQEQEVDDDNDVPSLPPVFGRKGQTDDKE